MRKKDVRLHSCGLFCRLFHALCLRLCIIICYAYLLLSSSVVRIFYYHHLVCVSSLGLKLGGRRVTEAEE